MSNFRLAVVVGQLLWGVVAVWRLLRGDEHGADVPVVNVLLTQIIYELRGRR